MGAIPQVGRKEEGTRASVVTKSSTEEVRLEF